MSKYTKGKLDISNEGNLGKDARCELQISGECIAKMADLSENSYASARELVRRWNCHEKLVDACSRLSAIVGGLMFNTKVSIENPAKQYKNDYELAKAALTEAQE